MDLNSYKSVFFMGIGGIGMSGLALWFKQAGYSVAGYDRTASAITNNLSEKGISIIYNDNINAVSEEFTKDKHNTLVIYTPAVPESNGILDFFVKNKFNVIKRSVALGLIVNKKRGIGIAGTHGKTSISSMVAWLLHDECDAFLGGISKNLNSNILINPKADIAVIEADEFDRSFLTLNPEIGLISAIDADHLDIYNDYNTIKDTFSEYIARIKPSGALVSKAGIDIDKNANTQIRYYTYALNDKTADFYADDIKIKDGYYNFIFCYKNNRIKVSLGVPGLYNVENMIGAMACVALANPDALQKNRPQNYLGVKRRFDIRLKSDQIIYIDDYAHHPEEIKACVNSVKHLFSGKKILGVFQPHLFSRTKDFYKEFAEALSLCDKVIITDIYPAREEPIDGVDSMLIYDRIVTEKEYCSYEDVVNCVDNEDTDIVLTMGAGDIDRLVDPIEECLRNKIFQKS